MKNDKWNAIKAKYFQGLSSLAEEKDLKRQSEDPYFHTLKEEGQESMDWDFDQFLDAAARKALVVPLVKKSFRNSILKYVSGIAALFIGGFLIYAFLQQHKPEVVHVVKNTDQVPSKSIDRSVAVPVLPIQAIPTERVLPHTEPQATLVKAKRKKINKAAPIVNNEALEMEQPEETYVVVNGKAITNRDEAEAITRNSLILMASNIQEGRSALEKMKYIYVEL